MDCCTVQQVLIHHLPSLASPTLYPFAPLGMGLGNGSGDWPAPVSSVSLEILGNSTSACIAYGCSLLTSGIIKPLAVFSSELYKQHDQALEQ